MHKNLVQNICVQHRYRDFHCWGILTWFVVCSSDSTAVTSQSLMMS